MAPKLRLLSSQNIPKPFFERPVTEGVSERRLSLDPLSPLRVLVWGLPPLKPLVLLSLF